MEQRDRGLVVPKWDQRNVRGGWRGARLCKCDERRESAWGHCPSRGSDASDASEACRSRVARAWTLGALAMPAKRAPAMSEPFANGTCSAWGIVH